MFDAAIAGDIATLKSWLEQGRSVNYLFADGPALLAAAGNGRIETVQFLVSHGAALELANKKGTTPLIIVCCYAHTITTRYLLEQGADPNHANLFGYTPLMATARYGRLEIAEQLVSFGADVNARTHEGRSPLMLAAESGHINVVKLLMLSRAFE